jgi:hypothetical protein
MNPPLSESMAECPDCGAMQSRVLVPCWLCGKPLGPEHLLLDAEVVEPPNTVAETIFGAITGLIIVLALMVGIGFIVDNPEGAVVYFLVVVPAVAITLIRATARSSTGDFSWGETLLTLILSTVGVFAALIGLAIALLLALFVICLASMR